MEWSDEEGEWREADEERQDSVGLVSERERGEGEMEKVFREG